MTGANGMSGGGGLVNVQGEVLVNFLAADNVTWAMSKGGGGACDYLHPPSTKTSLSKSLHLYHSTDITKFLFC